MAGSDSSSFKLSRCLLPAHCLVRSPLDPSEICASNAMKKLQDRSRRCVSFGDRTASGAGITKARHEPAGTSPLGYRWDWSVHLTAH